MKRITLACSLLFVCLGWQLTAQVLNQPAAWPNTSWVVTGTYNLDPTVFEADPTLTANFAFDDNGAGSGSDDSIAAESPIIDLTPAFTAGETWIKVTVDYAFNFLAQDVLEFQYYDADAAAWTSWENSTLPESSTASDDYCSSPKTTYITTVLNIAGFTPAQLSGFKYRIFYDDDPAGADWNYGFCFDAPTITSETPPTCPQPTVLNIGAVTATTAELIWTEAGGALAWDIEWGAAGFVPTGTATIAGVTTNPYLLSGLDSSTAYDFYVRADCTGGDLSAWSGPFSFETSMVPPACGGNFYDTGGSTGNYSDDETLTYTIMPDVPGNVVTLNFIMVDVESCCDDLVVYNGAGTGGTVLAADLEAPDMFQSTDPTGALTVTFSSDGSVDNAGWEATVTCGLPPSCLAPTDLTATGVTATEANLGWTENDGATTWDIELVEVGTLPTGTPTNAGVTSNPYPATGLTPTTDYQFYVRSHCSDGTFSNWEGPFTFTTECSVFVPYYIEDFTTFVPDCWEEAGSGTPATGPSDFGNSSWLADDFLNDGTDPAVNINLYNTGKEEWVISPLIDLSGGSYELVYTAAVTDYASSNPPEGTGMGSDDEVQVLISEDNGTTWTNLRTYNQADFPSNTGDIEIIDLSTYTGIVKFAFWATEGTVNDDNDYDFFIDEFIVRIPPTCPQPTDLNAEVIDPSTVELSWTETGVATLWDIEIVNTGDTPTGTPDYTGVTDNPYTASGLDPVAEQEFYVRADCGAGDTSYWTGPYAFSLPLLVDCAVGPVNTVFCYESGEITEFYYQSSDGTPLNLTVNAGQVEDGWDEFIVIDSDGTTELYNGYGVNDDGELAGLTFQSSGDNITVRVEPDGGGDCGSSSSINPIDITVSCATCINPTATYDVVSDCDSGIDQFFVDVEITSLGDATSVTIADDQTSPTQTATAIGIVTFGPYPNGTEIQFTVTNDQDGNCVITSPTQTQEFCPPTNDECADAEVAFVNDDKFCVQTTQVVLPGATPSSPDVSCGGTVVQDVWFEFTALSTTQMIALIDSPFSVSHAVYEGECGSLTEIFCSEEFSEFGNSTSSVATGLTIGETYYVRVFSSSTVSTAFEMCITTPTYGENVTCSELEPFCAPTDDSGNPEPIIFPSGYFYLTETVAETGPDYGCLSSQPNPAWYYLQIQTAGDLTIEIIQNTAFDADGNPIGEGLDVDFVAWGPFDSLEECDNLVTANILPDSYPNDDTDPVGYGCSYSAAPEELLGISDAEPGDIYILLITNYRQYPGYISMEQINFGDTGAGTTDCTILDETIYACAGTETTFTSQFPDAIAYVWYEYDAATDSYVVIAGEDTLSLTVSEAGTYKLVSFDSTGASTEEIFTLVYSPSPAVDLGPDLSLCGISSVTLDGTIANPTELGTVTYAWFDENGVIPGETQPTLNVTAVGTYSVEVTGAILDENGFETEDFCTTTDEIVVTDADFTVDLGGDQVFCDQDSYIIDPVITGEDEAGATYLWSTGETTPTITVTETNVYTVTVSVNNCSSPALSVQVTFNESPTFDLGADVATCDLTNLVLDATPSNFTVAEATFEWSQDGTVLPGETGPTLTVSDYGVYAVTVYADDASCATTQEITITEVNPSVTISSGDPENSFCSGETITLTTEVTDQTDAEISYTWFKDGTEMSEETSDINVTESGTYKVTVLNGACEFSDEVTISIQACNIPQGISPNGDQFNQSWDLSFLTINSLEIFNRNGRSVYSKTGGYTDEWEGQTDGGDKLVTGTYYYVIKLEDGETFKGKQVLTGWVYINREIN